MSGGVRHLLRVLGLVLVCGVSLQVYFLARIGMMSVVDPQSTTFQRSEMRRIVAAQHQLLWSQRWVDDERISDHLKRAVIASEDAGFTEHSGVEWEALEKAWEKNLRAEAQAARVNERHAKQAARSNRPPPEKPKATPKIVGGSTITQQLAKNLFLSGERTLVRKGQEFVLTLMLEHLLSKQRILEIYLNSVEWGEGIFGAEAAAQHYFRKPASQLNSYEAARLAVMLPRPRYYEKLPNSGYLASRTGVIAGRMGDAQLP
jgi:monofunctional biosynthetic peptidoglycan transglycosylase